jgi:hypothetical protein
MVKGVHRRIIKREAKFGNFNSRALPII